MVIIITLERVCCCQDSYEQLRGFRGLDILQRCPHCLAGLTAPDDDDDDDYDELDILQQCHSPSWLDKVPA